MWLTKLGWLLVLGLLAVSFAYTGSGMVLAFALMLVLLPLVSIPVHLYLGKHLGLELKASQSLRKGDRGAFRLTLHNPTWLPVLRLRCRVRVENQLNGSIRDQWVTTGLLPRQERVLSLLTGDDYCGRLKITVSRVRLYDGFCLVGIPSRQEATGHMTVQPDTFPQSIHLLPSPGTLEDSDVYSPDRPGQDLSEPYQIREYVPGDSPRQIHWKLTSKFDRLIVRDPSLPITRSVLVFWERTGISGDPEQTDAQAEVVVSLCRNLLEHSIRFTIGWNDPRSRQCVLREIRDLEELTGYLPRILQAAGSKEGESGASLLLGGDYDLPAHIVYIGEEPQNEVLDLSRWGLLTLLTSSSRAPEGAIRFTPEKMEEELAVIEI